MIALFFSLATCLIPCSLAPPTPEEKLERYADVIQMYGSEVAYIVYQGEATGAVLFTGYQDLKSAAVIAVGVSNQGDAKPALFQGWQSVRLFDPVSSTTTTEYATTVSHHIFLIGLPSGSDIRLSRIRLRSYSSSGELWEKLESRSCELTALGELITLDWSSCQFVL